MPTGLAVSLLGFASMLWRIGSLVGALVVLVSVGVAVFRVDWLESHEVRSLERVTFSEAEPLDGDRGVTLSRVHLEQDHVVGFEMCAEDPMLPERWQDALSVAVARPATGEVMTESTLDEEVLGLVNRNDEAGCLQIGSGTIGQTDDYAVEAHWETRPAALEQVPLFVRVVGRHPLGVTDLLLVFLTWLGGLIMVGTLAFRAPRDVTEAEAPPAQDRWDAELRKPSWFAKVPDEARALVGVGLMALLFFLFGYVSVGAAGGAALMFGIAALEIGVAFALARGPGLENRMSRLGLARPRRWYVWFPVALLAGVLLWFLATTATRLVPSTGVSSVQMLVSWPSGMLSFAVPAVIVPIAEELFFRGFVFGALERRSRALAFTGAWLLFVIAHVPQTFGQWGALVAITVAGLGFTTLRTLSRSTLVSALAHLVYNGILALGAVA